MVKSEPGVDPSSPVARSVRRRFTPEIRQAIISRYVAGESAKRLAPVMHVGSRWRTLCHMDTPSRPGYPPISPVTTNGRFSLP